MAGIALLAACGAQLATLHQRRLADGERRARAALGPLEIRGGARPAELARLGRLATLEAELGNSWEATRAAELAVQAARADLALALAGHGDARAAAAALTATIDAAVALAGRLDAPDLIINVVDAREVPPAHRVAHAHAVARRLHLVDRGAHDAAWAQLAGDPARRALLERARTFDAPAQQLSVAELRGLGRGAVDLLGGRLEAAAIAADRGRVRELAGVLLAIDPWHVPALLASLHEVDVAAGRAPADARLLNDVVASAATPAQLARLERAHATSPKAHGLTLARAWRFHQLGLFGDAQATLAPVLADAGADERLRAAAGAIRAFGRLGAGDPRGYAAWAGPARAGESVFATLTEVEHGHAEGAPPALAARGRRAAERAVAGGFGVERAHRWTVLHSVAIDDEAARPLRLRAIATMRGGWAEGAMVAADCLERGRPRAACEQRLEHADAVTDAEVEPATRLAALLALADLPGLPAEWLWVSDVLDAAQLARLLPLLVQLEDTRVAASEAYVWTRTLIELVDGDADAAARRLGRDGGLVRPRWRLWLRLAVLDVKARSIGADGLLAARTFMDAPSWLATHRISGPLSTEQTQGLARANPGPARVARFARALGAWSQGDRSVVLAELEPLLAEVDGEDGAELAALVALAAHELGQATVETRALARARKLSPHIDGLAYLRAYHALADQDSGASLEALAEVMARHPLLAAGVRDYLFVLARHAPGAEGARRGLELLQGLRTPWHPWAWLEAPLADGRIGTGAQLDGALDAYSELEPALAAGARLVALPEVASTVTQEARRALAEGDVGAALALAPRAAAYLESIELAPEQRRLVAWLWFVAGDADRARRVALEPKQGALSPWFLPVLLAPVRASLPDALTLDLYRAEDNPARSVEAARALLANLPDTPLANAAACHLLVVGELASEALAPCWKAFAHDPIDAQLVTRLTWVYLTVDESAARASGIDLDRLHAEARRRVADPELGTWLHNIAVGYERRGRHADAVDAELEAWSLGFEPFDVALDPLTLDERPWAARVQDVVQLPSVGARRLHGRLGLAALRAGDVAVARVHLDAAAAWRPVAARGRGDGNDDDDDPAAVAAEAEDNRLIATDLLVLAESDLAGRLVDVAAMRGGFSAAEDSADELERLHQRWPESAYVGVFFAEALNHRSRTDESLPLLRKLWQRHAGNVLVAGDLLNALVLTRQYREARALLATVRRAHPDDPRISGWQVPYGPDGSVAVVPPFARSAEAFEARLAQVPEAALTALAPTRHASVDLAAEAFFAADHQIGPQLMSSADTVGVKLGIASQPRAARCDGYACLQPIVESLSQLRLLWHAPVGLPDGLAHQALLAGPDGVMLMVSVPAGGRLFVLFVGMRADAIEGALPQLVLLRRSFRALDRVVSARKAEALRAAAAPLGDTVRHAARHELASAKPRAAGASCPVPDALAAAASDAARGALLLDLALSTGDARLRRALTACAPPAGALAAPLGLVALLDEDPIVHDWGRAVTTAHPAVVLADATRVLLDDDGAPLSSQRDEQILPAFGVAQVLAALPLAQRQQLIARLSASASAARWRVLALLAPGLWPEGLDRRALREAVRSGPARSAVLATHALAEAPVREDLEAMRARLDGAAAPLDRDTRVLVGVLAGTLAGELDPADAVRFTRVAGLLESGAAKDERELAAAQARGVRRLGRLHARGLAILGGKGRKPARAPARHDEIDALARRWVARLRRGAGAGGTPAASSAVTTAMLESRPLATLLPGPGWSLARLAQPELFSATARGLGVRLRGATDADRALTQRLAAGMAEHLVGDFFSPEGGLDLARPIECAGPAGGGDGFVCVAHVADRAAVRAALARRASADDASGASAPLQLATQGFVAPLVLAALPVLAHYGFSMDDGPGEGASQRLLSERLRDRVVVRGHALERSAVLDLVDGTGSDYDTELALFVGDRVWLFSDRETADEILAGPPARGDALADSPKFQALTRGWKDGGALQAVTLGASSWLAEEVAFEVAASGQGVDFRVTGAVRERLGSVDAVVAALPDGAVSMIAFAQTPEKPGGADGDAAGGADRDDDGADDDDDALDGRWATRPELGAAPPMWLQPVGSQLALAWYPEGVQPLWARWVGAVGLDARVREACKQRGLVLPKPGALVEHGGLTWAVRGEVLVVGAPRALVEAALARPAAKSAAASGSRRVAAGHLDGARGASALVALASGRRAGDTIAGYLKVFATLVGITREVELEAWQDVKTGAYRLEAHVAPNLSEVGVDTEVVDQWLASRSLRNSARLPRVVARKELDGAIALEIEVDNARSVAARAFPASPRATVTVLDDRHLRVVSAPGPTLDQPVAASPLGQRERERLLRAEGAFTADAPELVTLVREIVPAGAPPAEAARLIVAWIHKKLVYEITPEGLDALTILARGRGDCTEYSTLAVTLLRAAGVPAELREGMALDRSELVAHAWVAFHDGTGWRELEPTWGFTYVDAGHLEVSVMDFIALVSVDRLKVTKVEAAGRK